MSKSLNLATLLAAVLCFGLTSAYGEEPDKTPTTATEVTPPTQDGTKPVESTPSEATATAEVTAATIPVGLSDAEKAELAAEFDAFFASDEFSKKLDEKVAKLVPAHVDAHLELVLPSKVNELVEKHVGPLVGVAVREQLPSAIRAQRDSFAAAAVTAMDKRLTARGTVPVSTTSAAPSTVPSLVTTVVASVPSTTATAATPVKTVTSDKPSTWFFEGRTWYLNDDGTYHEKPQAGRSYATTNCSGVNGTCIRN